MTRPVVVFAALTLLLSFSSIVDSGAHAQAPVFEPPVPLSPTALVDVGPDFLATAATTGTGTWVVAWSSTESLNGTLGGDKDLLFARSTDGGLTFTAEAPLNTNATNDTVYFFDIVSGIHDIDPSLAAHGNRFIAVWHREDPFNPSGNSIELARSDDAGAHWSDPATLYDNSVSPSIASDGAGTWVIVWRRGVNMFNDPEIYFTRSVDDGMTWAPPTALATNAATETMRDISPRVVWSNGVWVVVWTATSNPIVTESHALFARSIDGGATWSAPASLHTGVPDAFDGAPAVASDGTGNWIAAWSNSDTDPGGLLVARSSDGALTWSAAVPLNTDFATEERVNDEVSVAAAGPGLYAAMWRRLGTDANPGSNHSDLVQATSTDGGLTWSPPAPLNPSAAAAGTAFIYDGLPTIVADPAGYFLAIWVSNDSSLASGTKGQDYDIVMALGGHPCGNGALDAGEVCDDGDRGSLDCCGRACAFDPAGTVCAPDADLCTLERCDGNGACAHPNAPLGTPCTLDGDICTFDRCDGNSVCEHAFEPHPDCRVPLSPGSSTVEIGGGDPAKRKITWNWKNGPAIEHSQVSIYVAGSDYALCAYDGTGLVARGDIPGGETCGNGKPCWTPSSHAMTYLDRDATPNGVKQAKFRVGGDGEAKIKVIARGPNLGAPALPVASLPLRVQLISDTEKICFDSTYSAAGVKTTTAVRFRAKGD